MTEETRVENASEAWLTDPTVFAVNRVPAHSEHRYYAHMPQGDERSDLRQSLNGEWRVEVVQASDIDFHEEPFVAENFDDSAFERIQVPGHLQTAGLMNHKYVNIQYPWDGHENPLEPNVPESNHVALYRRKFTVSDRLAGTKAAGGTVSIVFHGMATAIYVWVNGLFAGYGEDGFTPNEFDVTDLLHDGENVVAVACYEYSSASWLEDQDFWRLHGLFRPVRLCRQSLCWLRCPCPGRFRCRFGSHHDIRFGWLCFFLCCCCFCCLSRYFRYCHFFRLFCPRLRMIASLCLSSELAADCCNQYSSHDHATKDSQPPLHPLIQFH